MRHQTGEEGRYCRKGGGGGGGGGGSKTPDGVEVRFQGAYLGWSSVCTICLEALISDDSMVDGSSSLLSFPENRQFPVENSRSRQIALSVLPCDHVFHSSCATQWLTKFNGTCPMCKRPALRQAPLLPRGEEEASRHCGAWFRQHLFAAARGLGTAGGSDSLDSETQRTESRGRLQSRGSSAVHQADGGAVEFGAASGERSHDNTRRAQWATAALELAPLLPRGMISGGGRGTGSELPQQHSSYGGAAVEEAQNGDAAPG